jgi:hypothetical protein
LGAVGLEELVEVGDGLGLLVVVVVVAQWDLVSFKPPSLHLAGIAIKIATQARPPKMGGARRGRPRARGRARRRGFYSQVARIPLVAQEGKGARPPRQASQIPWGARRAAWVVLGGVALWALGAGVALGDTVRLSRWSLPLRPGVVLDFDTSQLHGFADTYTSRISILQVSSHEARVEQVKFQWRMFEAKKNPHFDSTGWVTTTGFARGRTFNAWWTEGQDAITRDTHLWLSQEACEELDSKGETRFALDLNVRGDTPLRLWVVGEGSFTVKVGGVARALEVWELRSEKEDRLKVLRDCRNPLVVEGELPGIYVMRLRAVTLGDAEERP